MTDEYDSCGCKVGRVAEKHGLTVDDNLVSRWTTERESTRKLADWFNRRVLESALQTASFSPRDGEVTNIYRLLTGDDVTSGTRIETRADLERQGVDVESVEADFCSHQTVYNHLTTCLGASLTEPTAEQRRSDAVETLGSLRSRTEAVTVDTIDRLDRHGAVDIEGFDVLVSVTVSCTECHEQYTVRDFLRAGGCDRCRE